MSEYSRYAMGLMNPYLDVKGEKMGGRGRSKTKDPYLTVIEKERP